ncbi:MAG: mechanosensitive ion channel family protein [Verrucomicrobiales bacterium]|nr:mechanosensitive ion channel family protein [Verrucomicrobiales bacterium]
MKLAFQEVYRGCLVFFACLILFSFWADAQPPARTNAPNATAPGESATPSPGKTLFEPNELLTFGLDRVPLLGETKIAGFPLWQYLASLIYIFLAFYISKFLDFLARGYLKRWAERTETKFGNLLVTMINGPIKAISFVILLYIGLQVFQWPAWIENILKTGLTVAVAISLTYLAMRLVDVLSKEWMESLFKGQDRSFKDQLFPIIRQSLRVFIIVIAVLLTSQNLGLQVTALIGSLGVVGLALSLASKDTVENFFGAVAVLVDKPFKVGDQIKLEGMEGAVESIGLRSTRVRHPDGHLITVPNKTMGNATITNITLRRNIKTVLNLGLTYDTPARKVKQALQILEQTYRGHPMTLDVWISFNQFAESALNIQVIHWWKATDFKAYLAGMQALNLSIKQQFEDAQINFAFPSRTVYVKQDSDWRVSALPNGEGKVDLETDKSRGRT